MSQIFISYRRADTQPAADRLHDRLAAALGADAVFKDVSDIRAGDDFFKVLLAELDQCDIILVLIGPQWTQLTHAQGRRRLDDPDDVVRIEVETSLRSPRKRVIPVLVNGTPMPRADELPSTLRDLVRRNALPLRADPDFDADVARLMAEIRVPLGPAPTAAAPVAHPRGHRPLHPGRLLLALAAALALVALAFNQTLAPNDLTPAATLAPTMEATLTPAPVTFPPVRVGVARLSGDCPPGLQAALAELASQRPAANDPTPITVTALAEGFASGDDARAYAAENGMDLLVWGGCGPDAPAAVSVELIAPAAPNLPLHPAALTADVFTPGAVADLALAAADYLAGEKDTDYLRAARALANPARYSADETAQAAMRWLQANGWLLAGCYAEARRVYAGLPDDAQVTLNRGMATVNYGLALQANLGTPQGCPPSTADPDDSASALLAAARRDFEAAAAQTDDPRLATLAALHSGRAGYLLGDLTAEVDYTAALADCDRALALAGDDTRLQGASRLCGAAAAVRRFVQLPVATQNTCAAHEDLDRADSTLRALFAAGRSEATFWSGIIALARSELTDPACQPDQAAAGAEAGRLFCVYLDQVAGERAWSALERQLRGVAESYAGDCAA